MNQDEGAGPLGRKCAEHGSMAVKHEAGTTNGWWERWHFRCGCKEVKGLAPVERGDLVTIHDPHGIGTVRGIVTTATANTIALMSDPFPDL